MKGTRHKNNPSLLTFSDAKQLCRADSLFVRISGYWGHTYAPLRYAEQHSTLLKQNPFRHGFTVPGHLPRRKDQQRRLAGTKQIDATLEPIHRVHPLSKRCPGNLFNHPAQHNNRISRTNKVYRNPSANTFDAVHQTVSDYRHA